MKIVISPAKSLDYESVLPVEKFTQGSFLNQASQLNQVLKTKSPKDLSEMMHISDKLGELNWTRNQQWQLPFNPDNARQAIFAFNGDVYTGLDAYTLSESKIDFLQDSLRILSGQYGILKPLDLMQPYRLEMGTKIAVENHNNLYQFWNESPSLFLQNEMDTKEVLVNLASNEYFKVIKPKVLNRTIITPHFKDYKDGKLKNISFFAKKARGLMVRFIADQTITEVEKLKTFNYEGYAFDASLSTTTDWVFTR